MCFMTSFAEPSLDLLTPGTEVTGLRSPADFDELVWSIGRSLLASFDIEHPGFPAEPIQETLLQGSIESSYRDRQPGTIEEKFTHLPNDGIPFAHIVFPTTPPSNWFLRGYHTNVMTGVRTDEQTHLLETKVYLQQVSRRTGGPVQVLKSTDRYVRFVPTGQFSDYLARRLKQRMQVATPYSRAVFYGREVDFSNVGDYTQQTGRTGAGHP